MLQLTPQMRILVAVEAVDFRKGIDSLAELCRAKLNADPFSGCLFVFRSRRATSIKVLVYDGQGFWLATKYPDPVALDLIRAAFRLSASVIQNDPRQFASQMVGRLLPSKGRAHVDHFITTVTQGSPSSWLRPL